MPTVEQKKTSVDVEYPYSDEDLLKDNETYDKGNHATDGGVNGSDLDDFISSAVKFQDVIFACELCGVNFKSNIFMKMY